MNLQPLLERRKCGILFFVKVICLLLGFMMMAGLTPCQAQDPNRLLPIRVIINGFKVPPDKAIPRAVRWPVEVTIHYEGKDLTKDFTVVQTDERDPVIEIPAGRALITATVKDRPNVKLKESLSESTAEPNADGKTYITIINSLSSIRLWFDVPTDSGDAQARPPVVFLPGVAGSILNSGNPLKLEVWPEAEVANRAGMALEPDGKTPAVNATITVGDVLRRNFMDFYGDFLKSLVAQGYTEGTDLVALPYDWRLSNETHFEHLDTVIDEMTRRTGRFKVVLAAHSMGGVIARAYVYSSPERAARVESIVTMGTPYLGAPKVYYGLINGYQFGNDTVRQELMKVLMQNYPAAYQLLPQKPFINDVSNGNRLMNLDEVNAIRYKWYTNVRPGVLWDDYPDTKDNERFFNPGLLQQAKQFMSDVLDANGNVKPFPTGVKQYVIIGSGVATLSKYELSDWNPESTSPFLELGDRKVVLHPVFQDGDGTVPLWSLETPTATQTYYVPYYHGPLYGMDVTSAHGDLTANPAVQEIVAQILKRTPPATNAYPRPEQYMDFPRYPGKVLEKLVDFELHSDAHLRISHESGKALGFNKKGGIDESLPGTFLCQDEGEYASFSGLDAPLTATVSGIRTGKFTLDVRITRPGGTPTKFSYHEVPVKNGTLATMTLAAGQTTALPALSVTTDGKTIMVPATLASQGTLPTSQGTTPVKDNGGGTGNTGNANNSPLDLSGVWQDDTGSDAVYRVRQIGDKFYWGVDATSLKSFANVFQGEIVGNTIAGEWVDLPGSPALSGGTMTLRIESRDKLIKVTSSNLYIGREWTRQRGSIGQPPILTQPAITPPTIKIPGGATRAEPKITSVSHDARRTLITGDVIQITMRGTPGLRATYDLPPIIKGAALFEFDAGEYVATYKVKAGDAVQNGHITAYLRNEGGEDFSQAREAITIGTAKPVTPPIVIPPIVVIPPPPTPTTARGFAGDWDTDWGDMTLKQNGDHVTGTYSQPNHWNGTIDGTVTGGVLRFYWTQDDRPYGGAGKFTLSADGKSFAGYFSNNSKDFENQSGGGWRGNRKKPQ